LRAISLPLSIGIIGSKAFAGCSSLVSAEFPLGTKVSIGTLAFEDCSALANLSLPKDCGYLRNDSEFDGCKALFDKTRKIGSPSIIATLESRFRSRPVHKSCYHASTTTVDQLRRDIERSRSDGSNCDDLPKRHRSHNLVDLFGMTPFHVLLSSATPRQDLLGVLLEEYPPWLIGMKDGRGKRAMDYLCMSCTRESQLLMKAVLEGWVDRPFIQSNTRAREDMARRIEGVLCEWNGQGKVVLLKGLYGAEKGYRKVEATSLLELWLWKMMMIVSSGADDGEDDLMYRGGCRVQCGALFIIPAVMEYYLGDDVEDSDSITFSDSHDYYSGYPEYSVW